MDYELPNCRDHWSFDLAWGQLTIRVGLGRFADGSLLELFLQAGKDGTQIDILLREMAITTSFALRHGAIASEIADELPCDEAGKPIGPMGQLFARLRLDDAAAALDAAGRAPGGCGEDWP